MKYILPIILISLIMASCTDEKGIQYPETKKVDTVDVYFGTQVADPYRWLEDDNSEETKAWVKAQNEVTFAYLDEIKFRDKLRKRFTEIWDYPKYGVPFKRGGLYFFFKNDGMQNQSVLYMQKNLDDEPELLLDPNTLAEDGTIALTGMGVSKNGKYLAYKTSSGGSDWGEIFVMEIESRKILDDHIKWVKFSDVSWFGDGFFYSAYDAPESGDELSAKNEFHKIWYHKIGTSQDDDVLVMSNPDEPLRNFYAKTTRDESFLIVSESESTSGNALYAAKLTPNKMIFKLVKIADGFEYDYNVVGNWQDQLLVMTNYEAPNQQLLLIDFNRPMQDDWQTIIPENQDVLEDAEIAGDVIFTQYLADAQNKAYFHDKNGKLLSELNLPSVGTMYSFNAVAEEHMAFYGFTSFTFPSSIYTFDMKTGASELYHQSEVDFTPEDYETRQVFYASKDGTKVPMFIVHKKGIKLDGENPTLLYGYGGFNISLTPSFSIGRIPFLEAGGVFVMANLRGGGEYGENWHEAGTKMNKQNVFDDFIAAAEWLVDNDYTNPDKLAILGGSNGGLLVGAAMTQRPELFEVAIPLVGVLDMLRFQKFTIGWAWKADYGSSEDSPEMFEYLYGYSPLHNLKEGTSYPATLAITADHDDRVVPAHTFKFIATLQDKHQGKQPVLARIGVKAGHGAGKPTAKQIEEVTDIYAFIMYNLGMQPNYQ